jgi:RNA polymerase sigma factor (sigma-70 family)
LNEARTWARRRSLRIERERQTLAHPPTWELPRLDPEIAAAVRGLSLRQRAVVVLTYWADLDPAAVAVRLGISEGSVRRHLARARARLREVLDAGRR